MSVLQTSTWRLRGAAGLAQGGSSGRGGAPELCAATLWPVPEPGQVPIEGAFADPLCVPEPPGCPMPACSLLTWAPCVWGRSQSCLSSVCNCLRVDPLTGSREGMCVTSMLPCHFFLVKYVITLPFLPGIIQTHAP